MRNKRKKISWDVGVRYKDVQRNNALAYIRFFSLVGAGICILASGLCTYFKDRDLEVLGDITDGSFKPYEK